MDDEKDSKLPTSPCAAIAASSSNPSPEEDLDIDWERDVKHLTEEQVFEICVGIFEDFKNNIELYNNDPEKKVTLKKAICVMLKRYHSKVYQRCTPEQKKNFAQYLTMDPFEQRMAALLKNFDSL